MEMVLKNVNSSELVIARYEFPDSVENTRRCAVGKKVLELYGIIQRSFDHEDDIAVARVIDFHKDRHIRYAHPNDEIDTTLGFISYGIDPEVDGAYIHHLVVDEEHRGRGIGSRLLRHVEGEAEQLGIGSITLRAWEDSPDFYLRKGYRKLDEQDNIMQLRIPRV